VQKKKKGTGTFSLRPPIKEENVVPNLGGSFDRLRTGGDRRDIMYEKKGHMKKRDRYIFT
jgi:hypothetical protein